MTAPILQPGQLFLMEMHVTSKDYDAMYDLFPEWLKQAKAKGCTLVISPEPVIWQPDEPRPATIYDGVMS